jgi:Secretion system C-terminal sorting domain
MLKNLLFFVAFILQLQTLNAQSCNLFNTTQEADNGWLYWTEGLDKIYVLFDPSAPIEDPLAPGCGLTYPFTIQTISYVLYDSEYFGINLVGSNLIYKIGIYDLAIDGDLCSGPGALIYLSDNISLAVNESLIYPQNLNTNVLVNQPFFVTYEVIDWNGNTGDVPTIGWDNAALPACRQYITEDGGTTIIDYIDFFTGSQWVGMSVFGTEGIVLPPPPANDDCVNSVLITENVQQNYDFTSATTDGPDQFGFACAAEFDTLTKDVWYTYVGSCNGTAKIDICGDFIAVNTSIGIYPGGVCPTFANYLSACNTQCELGGITIEFPILESQQYLIRLGVSPEEVNLTGAFTLEVDCDSLVGLAESFNETKNVNLYPNPSNGKFLLSCTDCLTNYSVAVYDVFGNTIKEISNIKGGSYLDIDLSSFSSGIYGVKLFDDKGAIGTSRIVIE